jgi:hypothetical protein
MAGRCVSSLSDDTRIHPRSHAKARASFLGIVDLFGRQDCAHADGHLRHLGADAAQRFERGVGAQRELDAITPPASRARASGTASSTRSIMSTAMTPVFWRWRVSNSVIA